MKKIITSIIFIALFISSSSAQRFNGVLFTVPDEVFYNGERYFINYTPLYPFEDYPSLFSNIPIVQIITSAVGQSMNGTAQNDILASIIQDSSL